MLDIKRPLFRFLCHCVTRTGTCNRPALDKAGELTDEGWQCAAIPYTCTDKKWTRSIQDGVWMVVYRTLARLCDSHPNQSLSFNRLEKGRWYKVRVQCAKIAPRAYFTSRTRTSYKLKCEKTFGVNTSEICRMEKNICTCRTIIYNARRCKLTWLSFRWDKGRIQKRDTKDVNRGYLPRVCEEFRKNQSSEYTSLNLHWSVRPQCKWIHIKKST